MRGLRWAAALPRAAPANALLAERLLTIDWQQRELPPARDADAGTWLLIITCDADDLSVPPPGSQMR